MGLLVKLPTFSRAKDIHDFIRHYRDEVVHPVRSLDVVTFRKYTAGEHAITLTEKQKDILAGLVGLLGHEYCDNICGQIVSEVAGRLQFLKWESADAPVKAYLDLLFESAGLKNLSTRVHYDMSRDGNVGVSLSFDTVKNRVRLYRELWWDGDSGVFVFYSPEYPDQIEMAVKEWTVHEINGTKYKRRTIWLSGEVQRWIDKGGTGEGWEEYKGEGADRSEMWPLRWVQKSGDPLSIPFVHFPNAGNTTDEFGLSELSGGFVGSQDQINDLQMTISSAARFTGYQMYTITGMKYEIDEATGQPKEIQVGPGAVLKSTSKDTSFGALPAGDLSQLISAYEHKLTTIARNARIPLHRLGQGNPPSGEALLRAEGPAIAKAERQVYVLKDRWADLGDKIIELERRWGSLAGTTLGTESGGAQPVSAIMEEPDRRDKVAKSVIVNNLAGRLSIRESLRMMEYSEEEVIRIYGEIVEEMAQVIALQPKPQGTQPRAQTA